MSKTIALGGDHAGYEYKAALIKHFEAAGFSTKNFGTDATASTI